MQEDNGTWGTVLFNILLVGVIGFLIYIIATGQNVLDVLHLSQYLNRNKDHIITYVSDDSDETYEITIDKDMDIMVEKVTECEDCDTESDDPIDADDDEVDADDEDDEEYFDDSDNDRIFGDEIIGGDESDKPSSYTVKFSDETKKKLKNTYIPKIFGGALTIKVNGYSDNEYAQKLIEAVLAQDESILQQSDE